MDGDQDGGWVSVSSGTGSPGYSRTKGCKTVLVVVVELTRKLHRLIVILVANVCGFTGIRPHTVQAKKYSRSSILQIHKNKFTSSVSLKYVC